MGIGVWILVMYALFAGSCHARLYAVVDAPDGFYPLPMTFDTSFLILLEHDGCKNNTLRVTSTDYVFEISPPYRIPMDTVRNFTLATSHPQSWVFFDSDCKHVAINAAALDFIAVHSLTCDLDGVCEVTIVFQLRSGSMKKHVFKTTPVQYVAMCTSIYATGARGILQVDPMCPTVRDVKK